MGEVSAAASLPCGAGYKGRRAGSTAAAACRDTRGYLRAVTVHFEGVDAGLVPALSLQEGAIFRQLQAGTAKMAPLKYFNPVMLAVLGTKGFESTKKKKMQQIISLAFIRQRGRPKGASEGECEKLSNTTSASMHKLMPHPSTPRQPEKQPETPQLCTRLHLPTAAIHMQTHRSWDALCSGTHNPSPICRSPPPAHKPSVPNTASATALALHALTQQKKIYIQSVQRC